MKDIVAHCDKTIDKKKDNIKDTETHWKNITEREEQKKPIKNHQKTIKNNEANTKRLLQEMFKKFNFLKYKPNSTTKDPLQPTKNKTRFQKSYASVVQGTNNTNTNVSITHKSNNTNAEFNSIQFIFRKYLVHQQP